MRQLDQDEREWIGALCIMTTIIFIPFSLMINLTDAPLDEWGKSLIEQKNIYESILWLIFYYGRVVSIVFFISPVFNFMKKLGFMDTVPKRWEIYLKTKKENKN